MMGTATIMPIPQIQLQNRSPTNMATPLIRAALPMSAGVNRNPSRLVLAITTPDICTMLVKVPNCKKAINPITPVTMIAPT